MAATGTVGQYAPTSTAATGTWNTKFQTKDGFDLIWRQKYLQEQMSAIEDDIRAIEQNANLSDTEKMFSMQMAMKKSGLAPSDID
ncbi:MAG: hypothetical protein ACOVOA_18635, partial [Allorhizobium sp.]